MLSLTVWAFTYTNLCPAPTGELAIALVIGVATQVCSATSCTNPAGDKGRRMRATTLSEVISGVAITTANLSVTLPLQTMMTAALP